MNPIQLVLFHRHKRLGMLSAEERKEGLIIIHKWLSSLNHGTWPNYWNERENRLLIIRAINSETGETDGSLTITRYEATQIKQALEQLVSLD